MLMVTVTGLDILVMFLTADRTVMGSNMVIVTGNIRAP